ncbi:MAG: hypothetical protein SF052_19055 [Bacteroidia bacterium]|nr:hypothetical protein [Bacteroidia bacterium]
MFRNYLSSLILAGFLLIGFQSIRSQTITLFANSDAFPVLHGIGKLTQAAAESEIRIIQTDQREKAQLSIVVPSPGLPPEGFEIRRGKTAGKWEILAGDATGAMYALLDIAENHRFQQGLLNINPTRETPRFSFRAIKFNLPWSPYREGEQMDLHSDVCRDLAFWEKYLDMMAQNRLNVLSLWSRHPFPFMIRAKNFPEACPLSDAELAQWQTFWKGLFRMAKQRGIETYIVNWNIVVSPQMAQAYGIKELNDTTELVRRYTRETVTQVINEYEDLTGLGVTLADWMNNFGPDQTMQAADREKWIEETFVKGLQAANRPARFIHRSVLAGSPVEMQKVIDKAGFSDPVHVEIKFNWSHGHSTPVLAMTHDFHSGAIDDRFWNPLPQNYRIQWMIRNEDMFILRWGEPDFVRSHIAENGKEYVTGYFVGSEGYIPAVDYSHLPGSHQTWQYAFEKQWMFYKVWGRLLYNPDTPDSVFEETFSIRYGKIAGGKMFKAFQLGSKMPLKLASFHAATWDYTLYSEGFLAPFAAKGLSDGHSAFISIDELINHQVLDPHYLNIPEYVDAIIHNYKIAEEITTPDKLANMLSSDANEILELLNEIRQSGVSPKGAFACELEDIETWAWLSLYFADKLRAAISLHAYRKGGAEQNKTQAIVLLTNCLSYWEKVSAITQSHYREVPYLGEKTSWNPKDAWVDAKTFSWGKYLPEVRRDLEIARIALRE